MNTPTISPILYSLDKLNKIRIFKVVVEETSEQGKSGFYNIITHTGLLNGRLLRKVKVIKQGKHLGKINETTVQEQAENEAISLYNAKLDEGYKSWQNLIDRGSSLGVDVDNLEEYDTNVANLFQILNIKYNTDQNWKKLPMLAEKWKDCKDQVRYPVITQPKLNGVRCIASYDADLQTVILSTRGGKTYSVPYIEKQLEPFFVFNQTLELDGELFNPDRTLQEISGAARNNKNQPDWLQYHLYDCLLNKTQVARLNDLRIFVKILQDQYKADKIFLVESSTANNEQEVIDQHNIEVSKGYEGLMVREPNALYAVSFRDKRLLKVKEFLDEEFELVDCEVNDNRDLDSFRFVLKNNIDDQTFKARPTGTLAQKQIWLNTPERWVGKKATICFQERTKGGLPHQGHVKHRDSEPLLEIIHDYE